MDLKRKILATLCTALLGVAQMHAEYNIEGGAYVVAGVGSNDFAPTYTYSNRHGIITQSKDALLGLRLQDTLDLQRRFDWSWGVEALTGWTSSADYRRWSIPDKGYVNNPQHPARIWLQQLYAEVKWRSLFLSIGMKNRGSSLVDDKLSSGDLVWSGNARGIPEVRIGFVDFQPVPFTKRWLQIDVCISYGKFMDTDWINNHYSYYRGKINPGTLWTYKRLYFRTNPEAPFHAKFGFQMTGLFGGHSYYYDKGVMTKDVDNYGGFKDFWEMLMPFGQGREGYKTGDHKGSWDISLQYRFRDKSTLRAYTQFFWEDGTGMSKSNGWDGLYGLEYKRPGKKWFSAAVAEYFDFTHQGGPVNFAPADFPNSSLTTQVRGVDNYYNNYFYRSYVNYGMTIGNPLVLGTLFNFNGLQQIYYNKVRAFHIAAEGYITPDLQWTAKYSHRKAWGQPNSWEILHPGKCDSWLTGVRWNLPSVKGLTLSAEVAADHGNLPQNAFGVYLGASYDCNFRFKDKKLKVTSVDNR
ncbi:MAG: capsule assembly Wzi family protein [Muribaculum sp.]|nr:capsule assembly Wzi family protein [Muribaculum sp.]